MITTPQFLAVWVGCLIAASSVGMAAAGLCRVTGVSKAHATGELDHGHDAQDMTGNQVYIAMMTKMELRHCRKLRRNQEITFPRRLQPGCSPNAAERKAMQTIAKIESYVGSGMFKVVVAQNMEGMCRHFMEELEAKRPICDTQIDLTKGTTRKQITINCDAKRVGYPTKARESSDLLAVMDLCVSTCMRDKSKTCCQVPVAAAGGFPCCRENCCCPDNIDDSTCVPKDQQTNTAHSTNNTMGRRRTQKKHGPRKAQVSVAISVAVEEGGQATSVYDALLRCLQNPAKLDAMCLTGSSGH